MHVASWLTGVGMHSIQGGDSLAQVERLQDQVRALQAELDAASDSDSTQLVCHYLHYCVLYLPFTRYLRAVSREPASQRLRPA